MANRHIKSNQIPWKEENAFGVKDSKFLKKVLEIDDYKKLRINIIRLDKNKQYPYHKHSDTEYVYILEGNMSDENDEYNKGDLIINFVNSEHSVKAGSKGCDILVFHIP